MHCHITQLPLWYAVVWKLNLVYKTTVDFKHKCFEEKMCKVCCYKISLV